MFFFKKALKYQSKKYATNSCNPKEENKTKRKTKTKINKKKKPVLHCLLTKSIAQQKMEWRTDDGEEWKLSRQFREESRKRK